jgi:hypothetical protein
MLPQGSASFLRSHNLGWKCLPPREMQELGTQNADTEANCRAKMLLYLLKEKLITLTTLNNK